MDNQVFRLIIRSSEGVVFEGQVESVSSNNSKGRFDILKFHANFISIIKDKILITQTDGQKKEFQIDNGLLRTKGDMVEIYLGIEGLAK